MPSGKKEVSMFDMLCYPSIHLIDEQDVESQPKGHDEDDEDDGKLGDGVDDVVEHEDEDAEVGDVAEVLEGVEPGEGDEEGADGPLPALLTFAPCRLKLDAEVKNENEGGEIENPVDKIGEAEISGRDDGHINDICDAFCLATLTSF